MSYRFGFTLVEMIVVIAIIGTLSTMGFAAYTNIQEDSRASRIAADFQQIKLAMKVWRSSGNTGQYPRETTLSPAVNFCTYNFYPIRLTGAQTYLENTMRDPWGQEYFYDNDGDTYISGNGATLTRGVNVNIWGCGNNAQRYRDVVDQIDRTIDGSDGANSGLVRWANSGSDFYIMFLIVNNELQ